MRRVRRREREAQRTSCKLGGEEFENEECVAQIAWMNDRQSWKDQEERQLLGRSGGLSGSRLTKSGAGVRAYASRTSERCSGATTYIIRTVKGA